MGGAGLILGLAILWALIRLGRRAGEAEQALSESAARLALAERRLEAMGAAPPTDPQLLEHWRRRMRDPGE